MGEKRKLEQQIAVFGESGSGKTVLLSSFYGATQEPQYRHRDLFYVVADDIGQGSRLHGNYLGMRNAAKLPMANHFSSEKYSLSIKLKDDAAAKRRPFDAVRLTWHDYPGEWFEQGVSGPVEAQRRVDGFRSLLGSDVALLLVDGQKLRENAGEEERYLKSLFGNFRNGLLSLKDDLLDDGKPLLQFPRIWVLSLSKADLLPDADVYWFRDLLVEKARGEIDALRGVIGEFIEGKEALSIGEDFVLLSAAKFEPGRIEVAERIGVELILPLSAILPFERHVRWAERKLLPGKLAEGLMRGAGMLAAALTGKRRRIYGRLAPILSFVEPLVIQEAARLAGDKLRELNKTASEKRDKLSATLTQFTLDLERGEQERTLIRSKR